MTDLDPSQAARTVARALLACVVGSRDELLELAGAGGAAPGLVHDAPAEGWIRARGAVAYHQGSCLTRLLPTDTPDDRPLLVAAMIVRDESEFLDGCLQSIADVVDRIEIADTGSLDDTVAIARARGATVETIEWRDDFAWARNTVLERCTDAHYVLWLDADERFTCDDVAALRRILATYRDIYPSFGIEVRNLGDDGATVSAFRANRIVRASGTRFEGAIHEQPRPADPGERWPLMDLASCHIDHLGYAASVLADRDKHSRNLEIAKRQPGGLTDPDAALNYLRSLDAAEQDPAVTLQALDELFPDVTIFEPGVQSYLLCMRADRLRSLGRFADGLAVAQDALGRVPADDQARYLVADLLQVDLHHRRPVAGGQAHHALEREEPVGAGLARLAAELLLEHRQEVLGATQGAGQVVAVLHHVAAMRPFEEQRVEAGHAAHLGRIHLEDGRHLVDGVLVQLPVGGLGQVQQADDGRGLPARRVAGDGGLDLFREASLQGIHGHAPSGRPRPGPGRGWRRR